MSAFQDDTTRNYQKKKENKVKAQAKSIVTLVGFFHDDPDLSGIFKMNQFSKEIVYTKAPPWDVTIQANKPIDDNDVISLKYHIARKFKIDYTISLLMEGIIYYATQNGWHPIRDYLKTLTWDGVKRVDEWLIKATGAEDNPYTRAVGRKFLTAAIKRIMNPGCKFDHMLILEGKQGIGKSTIANILGGQWYSEISLAENDKDTIDAMRGRWIMEVDEMVAFKKEDVERLKAFITHCVDRARLAYRRNTEEFPRQGIFMGTLNPDGDNTYFKDQTGNRRFWPVVCGDLNVGWLREHRDQLFAEAMEFYKLGEPLYLEADDVKEIAQSMQEERIRVDAWISVIRNWIITKRATLHAETDVAEIAKEALGIEAGRLTHFDQIRVGNVMAMLGYHSHRKVISGVRTRFYMIGTPVEFEGSQSKIDPTGDPIGKMQAFNE